MAVNNRELSIKFPSRTLRKVFSGCTLIKLAQKPLNRCGLFLIHPRGDTVKNLPDTPILQITHFVQ